MKNFVECLEKENNYTETEKGAVALKSTGESLLDLFGQVGALRSRDEENIESLFVKAFAEDRLLATKTAFYARDIRHGGLGERRTPKVFYNFIARLHPEIIEKNIEHIPYFGRWDDLYILIGTPVEDKMWGYIKETFENDAKNMGRGQQVTLLAKWLKSPYSKNKENKKLGRLTARKLGLTQKIYSRKLSALRRYLDIVEVKMSERKWDKINYPGVPSKAMSNYRNAFYRHDEERFETYIENVKQGKEKINAGTLYPYEIIERMGLDYNYNEDYFHGIDTGNFYFNNYDEVLEEQWRNLPNYVEGENNILIMADTSGSMWERPMYTSVGLAIYFAERNKGVFKNKFITFSRKPSFVEIKGDTLYEKIQSVPSIVDSTNLERAFKLILDTAINNNLKNEDLPKAMVVISDMQFDCAHGYEDPNETWHETMASLYKMNGYVLPNIVYWNVDSRRNTFQVTSKHKGVQLASGQSVSTFKAVVNNIDKTPYEAMLDVLNDPVYDVISV